MFPVYQIRILTLNGLLVKKIVIISEIYLLYNDNVVFVYKRIILVKLNLMVLDRNMKEQFR